MGEGGEGGWGGGGGRVGVGEGWGRGGHVRYERLARTGKHECTQVDAWPMLVANAGKKHLIS